MGLAFNLCDANWSYSGFNFFRTELAKEIEVELSKMEGFGGEKSWEDINDPIKPLLNHSDCDGELTPEECKTIAPRLLELIDSWEDCHNKQQALLLADGMYESVKINKPLEFC